MAPLKHPETPSGIPGRDWTLTKRRLDHVPVKKNPIFHLFCLVVKHQDCKLERIFLIKIYDIFKYVLLDEKPWTLLSSFVRQRWCSGMAIRSTCHYMARLRTWRCAGCRAKRWIKQHTSLVNGHETELLTPALYWSGRFKCQFVHSNTTVNTTAGKDRSAGRKKDALSWHHWLIDQFVDPQKPFWFDFLSNLPIKLNECESSHLHRYSPLTYGWVFSSKFMH